MKKNRKLFWAILIAFCALQPMIIADAIGDKQAEERREANALENERLEEQREEQRREDERLEEQREETRRAENAAYNRSHGW